ncbi:MAG: LytR C-terminal domain-containing protein [Gemmatimonadales bacterium]|nr:LytR C-terminal domain-containing protein [Gemmatimonadales bacterium]
MLAALAWGGWRVLTRPEHVAGHAFAVPSAEARVTVEVLNASGQSGAARTAARMLRRQGLDVVYTGNAAPVDSTRVLVRRGDRKAGERVRSALGGGSVRELADSTRHVDVSVLLGPDFVGPTEVHP